LSLETGLRSRRKINTAPAAKLFFHENGSGSSSGALGFRECGSGTEALFFQSMDPAPAPASVRCHTLLFSTVFGVLQVE